MRLVIIYFNKRLIFNLSKYPYNVKKNCKMNKVLLDN